MSEFTWEEPPETAFASVNRGPYYEIAVALRDHQGRWAKLSRKYRNVESARNAATNIRRGVTKGFKKGEYEAVAEGECVWVRYTGPVAPAETATRSQEPESDPEAQDPPHDQQIGPRVRQWAREQGRDVPERGRLPQQLVRDYFTAMGEPIPQHLRVVQ